MDPLALPPTDRVLDVVIDSDPMNEIDDQFAVVWALLRPDRLRVRALTAAPWQSDEKTYRDTDPQVDAGRHAPRLRAAVAPDEGQRQAFAELHRIVALMGVDVPVHAGADRFLPDAATPVPSAATEALIALAHEQRDGPLYVLGIACATNLASALLLDPDIADRVCVVWTSAHPSWWPRPTASYNLSLDLHASRLLFDSGVPLVYLPGYTVGEELRTTRAELERYLTGRGPVGDYLWDTWESHWMTRGQEPGPGQRGLPDRPELGADGRRTVPRARCGPAMAAPGGAPSHSGGVGHGPRRLLRRPVPAAGLSRDWRPLRSGRLVRPREQRLGWGHGGKMLECWHRYAVGQRTGQVSRILPGELTSHGLC